MVDRYVTPPIELPAPRSSFERADLVFYGLDHSGASSRPRSSSTPGGLGADATDTAPTSGSFFIFGHGGCFGDVGHCDIPTHGRPVRPATSAPAAPAIRVVTVTESIRRLVEAGEKAIPVTVVARTPGNRSDKVLQFDTVRLLSYA